MMLAAGEYRPSPAQEQLWLVHDLHPDTNEYNEIWSLNLYGALELERLEHAVNTIIRRHESLRSTFPVRGSGPVCQILPQLWIPLKQATDLSCLLPESARVPVAEEIASALAERPFDLENGPLMRAELIRFSELEHWLLVSTHHLVSDGGSLQVFLAELGAFYANSAAELAEPRRYADYAGEQHARMEGDGFAEETAYWTAQLDGAPDALELQPGRLRPPVKGTRGERLAIELDPALAQATRLGAAEIGYCTQAGLLLAAFAVVLSRYSGRFDLIIGTGADGRPDPRYDGVIGQFANPLPLRLRPRGELAFAEFAQVATETVLDALDHQELPFSRLVSLIGAGRDLSMTPLIQVVFKTADFPAGQLELGGLRVSVQQIRRTRSRYDLIVEAQPSASGLRVWIEYDSALFDETWVRQMTGHFGNVLAAATHDPALPLSELPMLSPQERGEWLPRPEPNGVQVPARELVLTGEGLLAPPGRIGRVHQVSPHAVRLHGDLVVESAAEPGLAATGYYGRMHGGGVEILGTERDFADIDGLLVPLDRIRAILAAHPSVRSVDVTVAAGQDARPRLAAALTFAPGDQVDLAELERYSAGLLPKHALPELSATAGVAGQAAPTWPAADPVSETVTMAWLSALDLDDADPADEFFASGGHSLAATRLAGSVRAALGVVFPVRAVFENPRLGELIEAARRAQEQPQAASGGVARPSGPVGGPWAARDSAPLTAAQEQIWVMEQLSSGRAVYHSPVFFEIEGALDAEALRTAFDATVATHEALRVGYRFSEARPVQFLLPEPPRLRVASLTGMPQPEGAAEAERLALQQALRPFALGREPGVRATLFVLAGGSARLALTIHHLAMDGTGFEVFLGQMGTAYEEARAGRVPKLPRSAMGWLEYAELERQHLERNRNRLTAFWSDHLANLAEPAPAPAGERPEGLHFDGENVELTLDAAASQALIESLRRRRATGLVRCTAALAAALHSRSARPELLLGTAMENRVLPGSEHLVGCAANLAVLRIRTGDDPALAELERRVALAVAAAQAYQELPFPDIVRTCGPRAVGGLPLVRVTTEWHDLGRMRLELPGCRTAWRFMQTGTARNDLVFTAGAEAGSVSLAADYNVRAWTGPEVTSLLEHTARILGAGQNAQEPEAMALNSSDGRNTIGAGSDRTDSEPDLDRTA